MQHFLKLGAGPKAISLLPAHPMYVCIISLPTVGRSPAANACLHVISASLHGLHYVKFKEEHVPV